MLPKSRFSMAVTLIILLFSSIALAQVPQVINYQGMLTDAGGTALNGSFTIEFKIYDAATAGNVLWTETQTVTVNAGLFDVLLGSVTPIPYTVFDGNDKFLSLKVGSDPEMTPRKRLVSVGYAFRAYNADKVDGKDASAFVEAGQANAITTPMIQDNAVTAAKIAPNIVSSLSGVSNDGGNIDLVAGSNITITPDDANNKITIAATGTGGGIGGSGTANYLPKFTGATTIGNSVVYESTGNIGIGTTNPTHKFHVFAQDAGGLFESSTNLSLLRLSTNEGLNNRVELKNNPGGRLSLWTAGGSDVFNITRDGKVGIGTANPGAKFHLVSEYAIFEGTSASVPNCPEIQFRETNSKSYWIMSKRGSAWSPEQNQLIFSFYDGSNWFQSMNLKTNKDVIFSGNVGIGTTSPQNKLEIANGNLGLFNSTDNKNYAFAYDAAGDYFFIDEVGVGRHLAIKNGGNIGIGTTNPTHKFHVVAQDAVGLFESSTNLAFLRLSTKEGLNNRVELKNNAGGMLSLWTAGGFDVLNITRDGKVGIRTTNPQAALDVRGEIKLHDGSYFAASSEENLRIVRGTVNPNGTVAAGQGFSVIKVAGGAGRYEIRFNNAFSSRPSVVVTQNSGNDSWGDWSRNTGDNAIIVAVRNDGFQVLTGAYSWSAVKDGHFPDDRKFEFIAAGPK